MIPGHPTSQASDLSRSVEIGPRPGSCAGAREDGALGVPHSGWEGGLCEADVLTEQDRFFLQGSQWPVTFCWPWTTGPQATPQRASGFTWIPSFRLGNDAAVSSHV